MTFPGLALVARNKCRLGMDEKIEKTIENRITRFKRNSNWFRRVTEENNVVYWYWNWINSCLNSLKKFTDDEKLFRIGKLYKVLNVSRRAFLYIRVSIEKCCIELYFAFILSYCYNVKSIRWKNCMFVLFTQGFMKNCTYIGIVNNIAASSII